MDPISQIPLALGAHWHACLPFVLTSSDQFRAPVPPAMTSAEYATAYDEAKNIGGDGINTPTIRTPDQTVAGIYWAYDGVPNLCAPPRLYNQIAVQLAHQMNLTGMELARFLTVRHVAHGRCRPRELGVEVLLQDLAAGLRDPRVGSGHGNLGARRRQRRDGG